MLTEHQLIQMIYDELRQTHRLNDDAFQLECTAPTEVAIDAIVEDHHFKLDFATPESVGYRALARPISDMYSVGAIPHSFFWHIQCPDHYATPSFWTGFLRGSRRWTEKHSMDLLGGDLTRSSSGPLSLSVTVLGQARKRRIGRTGAQAGDRLFVSAPLGAGAAELESFLSHPRIVDVQCAHLFPYPDHNKALHIAQYASATIDLSDDLQSSIASLERASGVRIELDANAIPIATSRLGIPVQLKHALVGGEDYAILFTVSPEDAVHFLEGYYAIGHVIT